MKKKIIISSTIFICLVTIFTFFNNNKVSANNVGATCNIDSSKNNSEFTDEFNIYNSNFFTKDCKEDFKVSYATPRIGNNAILAGTPFDYPVSSTSGVSCTVTQKSISIPTVSPVPIPEPRYRKECTYTSTCVTPPPPPPDHFLPGTGPTEDFEKCVVDCDGGEYSQSCIDKCVNEVYYKKMNLLDFYKFSGNDLFYKNEHVPVRKVCDCPYCDETESCVDVLENGEEIAAAHALNAKISEYNSRVSSIVSAFSAATGGKYSLSTSSQSYSGSFPDLSMFENGINDYNNIPADPAPRNPQIDMTITSDNSKDNRTYNLAINGGSYKIPYKSVINALTGEVYEMKNGQYPSFPYYDLTDEIKARAVVDKEGYNYFTNPMSKTTTLGILPDGTIDTNSKFGNDLNFNHRSIKLNVMVGGNNKLNITCGYDVINKLTEDKTTNNNSGGIQIMYRPINFDSVFPDRSPRWNWRSEQAKQVLKDQTKFNSNIYSDNKPEYEVLLTKENINMLRNLGDKYFINGAYDFKLVNCEGTNKDTCKSQLINNEGSSFIKRGRN